MAAGPPRAYLEGIFRTFTGDIDWTGDTFKAALLDDAYTPDVGAHLAYSDVSASEISMAGYTAGGITITNVAVTKDAGEVKVDCDDLDFGDAVSLSARYIAIYDDTTATKYLTHYIDLNDGSSGNVSSTNSHFDANLAATGLFRISDATA